MENISCHYGIKCITVGDMNMKTYRGITEEQYFEVMKEYSTRMFNLFDNDKTYNSNKGSSLMWLGSFTASLIAREVIDEHLDRQVPLFDALIQQLKECSPERAEDLNKLLTPPTKK